MKKKNVPMDYTKYEFTIVRKELDVNTWQVTRPAEAYNFFRQFAKDQTKESLFVLVLDGRNNLLGIQEVYRGTATGTSVRVAEILFPILINSGVAAVLVHNHPSGDPEISNEDAKLTLDVIQACSLMDITLLDHLVIGRDDFRSIRSQTPGMWEGSEDNV
jgi:DNA repair protein RadC